MQIWLKCVRKKFWTSKLSSWWCSNTGLHIEEVVVCIFVQFDILSYDSVHFAGKRAKKCNYNLVFKAMSPKFKGAHPRTICHRLGAPAGPKLSLLSQIQYYKDFTITKILYCTEVILCRFWMICFVNSTSHLILVWETEFTLGAATYN